MTRSLARFAVSIASLAVLTVGARAANAQARAVAGPPPQGPRAVSLTSTEGAYCAALETGAVYCWGQNAHGQLGNGTTVTSVQPVPARGITNATELSGNRFGTVCARLATGEVRCWGWSRANNPLTGQPSDTPAPSAIAGLTDAEHVVVGNSIACASHRGGGLSCWGALPTGQAVGTPTPAPQRIEGFRDVVELGASNDAVCARDGQGQVRCFGAGPMLGVPGARASASAQVIAGITGATALAVGDFHACAAVAGGAVRCWGMDDRRLGRGGPVPLPSANGNMLFGLAPGDVAGVRGATRVFNAWDAMAAVDASGRVFTWGAPHPFTRLPASTPASTVHTSSLAVTLPGVTNLRAAGSRFTTQGESNACALFASGAVGCYVVAPFARTVGGRTTPSDGPDELRVFAFPATPPTP